MPAAAASLDTVADFIRWGASRFNAAGLAFAHGTDNAVDEAASLVLHALHLPPEPPAYLLHGRLTREEKQAVIELLERRIRERRPAAYLTGRTWFAGLEILVDERVLVPRSPIAELIEGGFAPWLDPQRVSAVLDLGTGSGCIALACAVAFPRAAVDAADISPEALEVAARNIDAHGAGERVRLVRSDLFAGLAGRRYDLIVSNPPYLSEHELAGLPPEFAHEPRLGLVAGRDGLAAVSRILGEARRHLTDGGILVLEVGSAAQAVAQAWPELPFIWPEFSRGGSGVLMLTTQDFDRARAAGAA
ncbi:MAG TPA: 50S ribosomal protein L3 N(5)-glutamine methyltransferase [Gammaproteobacteria bacterium]|nr:50S ribosomal protein L3 N(5)-glutamine methyltransferase [Gammaproteobacteria bacterium]